MDSLNIVEQLIAWVAAIVMPLYALYSYKKSSARVRFPDGSRTTYDKKDKDRGFNVAMVLYVLGGILAWALILGLLE